MDTDKQIANSYNPEQLLDLLPLYYKRLFPHIPFYRWLSYGLSNIYYFLYIN